MEKRLPTNFRPAQLAVPVADCKILSIDGGGIRGALPASFLSTLATDFGSKHPLSRNFELIAGTSTGAIIALAIALDIPIQKVKQLYVTRGGQVFKHRLVSGPYSTLGSKYINEPLAKELEAVFEGRTLGQCVREVCIPAVDIATGKAVIFTRATHPDALAWKVAMASAAAPFYFPSVKFAGDEALPGLYADGGLWANNPALAAIGQAVASGRQLEDIWMLSLGTGDAVSRAGLKDHPSGLISWGFFLVDTVMFSQSTGIATVAHQLLGRRYYHLNITLREEECSLDALRAVERLVQLGAQDYCPAKTKILVKHHFFSHPVGE